MIYINKIRTNDLAINDSGAQFELGKGFMKSHNWGPGEHVLNVTFKSINKQYSDVDNVKFKSTMKVRSNERGGDREGVDCKEYFENNNNKRPFIEFFSQTLKLTNEVVGKCYFALQDIGADGEKFNLYFIDSSTNTIEFCNLLAQKDVEIEFEQIKPIFINVKNQYLNSIYRTYITSIKSKPFLLLAGISGTGKSRIVRELARACWEVGTSEYEAHKPKNFEMIQVKPNWHDSSELIGYLSNINGTRFIAGKFLEFVVKAWSEPEKPYFLCLDEMNLAPVEQYFAEYLSVIESRKLENDRIVTDAILSPDKQYSNETVSVNYNKLEESWYVNLINDLLVKTAASEEVQNSLRDQFKKDGIAIPQNLIVVGTVNMDETTFSFSRKVLDRAMTIEMNEVDLLGGLENKHEKIGPIGKKELIGDYVEGSDVYSSYKEVCDKALDYLKAINDKLEGTPFKVAYRTRNEFLLYVVNNLPYNKDEKGNDLPENFIIARALDEITNMKILSRIEGDETKFKGNFLEVLCSTISSKLAEISGDYIFVSKLDELKETDTTEDGRKMYASVSMAKLDEMKKRLESGYTSFWS